ncbi:MAG: hypothetical protein VW455_13105 [Nitrospinota bacterium]
MIKLMRELEQVRLLPAVVPVAPARKVLDRETLVQAQMDQVLKDQEALVVLVLEVMGVDQVETLIQPRPGVQVMVIPGIHQRVPVPVRMVGKL